MAIATIKRKMNAVTGEITVTDPKAAPVIEAPKRRGFPKNNRQALDERFGTLKLDPHGLTSQQWMNQFLMHLFPPWHMHSPITNDTPIQRIWINSEVVKELREALDRTWQYFERDQTKVDEVGLSTLVCSFVNPPLISANGELSLHCWGAAIRFGKSDLPKEVIKIFTDLGFVFTNGAFEAVDKT